MNRVLKFGLGLIALLFVSAAVGAPKSDIAVIKQRVVDELMKYSVNDEQVGNMVSSIRQDGTWPGINYEDVSRTGFEHSRHYSNMVTLARAYKTRGSKFFKNKKVKSTIELALKNWVDHDYFCDNWWYNQIGTPDNLVALMLLVGDELPKDLVAKAQPIIGRAHLTASGARPSGDRIKIAGILAKNLLFTGDNQQFDEVIRVIEGEIKFSTGQRGMQHDFSFHHREDRVNNTLSYGLGYADAFAEWAAYVAGTKYAFATDKINHLIDYYLDGISKQLVYGKYHDTGTKNRDISRQSSNRPFGTTTPEKLMLTTDYRKGELEQIIRIRKEDAASTLSFGKFFWQTEHYSHQRPHYFASVRMYSTRNRNMEEPYNSEGLKNHHRGDGTNYISVTGFEYHNMAPVTDWQKIPGTTVMQKPHMPAENEIQKDGLTEFVGAVTDGLYGAVVFDFKSPHDPVAAKKSWFFFDNEYVCLGTGISAPGSLPVATTVNQCLLDGEVTVMSAGRKSVQPVGERKLDNVSWIHHGGVGYIFPEASSVQLANQPQTGSWYSINQQSGMSKEEISMPVFKLWFDHGQRPRNASYAYIVAPGASASDLEAGKHSSPVKILSNTSDVQAVMHTSLNICQAIFYRAGELQLADGLKIVMDAPGLVMVKAAGGTVKEISVADPARRMGRMHLSVTGRVNFTGDHVTTAWNQAKGVTDISVDLPKTVYAGQSVTLK